MDSKLGGMGCSLMHGWCDVCKHKRAHSIWVTGVAVQRSPLHKVVCLQLSNLDSQVCFFLLSFDVVSSCWEIFGGGDLVQDTVTCSLLFLLWLYRGSLLFSSSLVAGSGEASCRGSETCSPQHPLAVTQCWGWCTLTSSFPSLCLYTPGLQEYQNKSSSGLNCK